MFLRRLPNVVYVMCNSILGVHCILGGHGISIEEAPYHVGYGESCNGVLIHTKWALTVAHCGNTTNYITIGSRFHQTGLQIPVTRHIIHPRFGEDHQFDFDIQLLELGRHVETNGKVQTVQLSGHRVDDDDDVLVSGWGYSREKGEYNVVLQQARLRVVPMKVCQEVDEFWYNTTLTDNMFCAGGKRGDACQGDSGGGALARGLLYGLSSFGYGCGRHPGVYTDVTRPGISSWILDYVEGVYR